MCLIVTAEKFADLISIAVTLAGIMARGFNWL